MESLLIFILFIVFSIIRYVVGKARQPQNPQGPSSAAPGHPVRPAQPGGGARPVRPVYSGESVRPGRSAFPQYSDPEAIPGPYTYTRDVSFDAPAAPQSPDMAAAGISRPGRRVRSQPAEKDEAPVFQLTPSRLVQAVVFSEVLGPPRSRSPWRYR